MPGQPQQSIVVPHISGFQGADGQSIRNALKQLQLFQRAAMTYGATPPWNQPWGRVASASVTSTQTGISTVTDVTNLAVTWTAVANRKYKIALSCGVRQLTADGTVQFVIATNAGTQVGAWAATLVTNAFGYANAFVDVSPAAGAVTYKARLLTSAGTIGTSVSATQPGSLIVEDVGPTGLRPAS